MIISALQLAYKSKPESWFNKPFLKSPKGAADYWSKVLKRRAQIWRERHREEKQRAEEAALMEESAPRYPASASVAMRLQRKLKQKKKQAGKELQKLGKKSSPIIVRDTDSSGSDDHNSDGEHASPEPTSAHTDKGEKTAPGPETYTRSEIKMFARMSQAIEDVDESRGHSNAVADFIDTEFSDNSGMMVKARRAPKGSWRKGRFTRACEKAAKIMDERQVTSP